LQDGIALAMNGVTRSRLNERDNERRY